MFAKVCVSVPSCDRSLQDYVYRHVRREDMEAVQALQIELFPVRYPQDFYENLIHKQMFVTIVIQHNQKVQKSGQKCFDNKIC